MKENFKKKIDNVKQFIQLTGTFPKESLNNREEQSLAYFIQDVKKKHRNNLLTKEEYQYIIENIPDFFDNRQKNTFGAHLDYIVKYKEEHGCFPCAEHWDEELGFVGSWMSLQRSRHKKGTLSKEREDALNAIGFVWTPLGGGTFKEIWISRFNEIKKKHDETGEWPRCADKRNYRWLCHQSRQYRCGKMEKWQIETLKSSGFDIENFGKTKRIAQDYESSWNEQMDIIIQFNQEKERLPEKDELQLPCGEDSLGWLKKQLKTYTSTAFKTEKFIQLGFDPKYDKCLEDRKFRKSAIQYKNEFRNTPYHQLPEDIQKWKTNIMTAIRKGTLKKNRKRLVEDLGIIDSLYKN